MDYDMAVKHYIDLRAENKRIMDEADALVAANKEKMEKLGIWIELKAEKDHLEKVPTKYGLVFWSKGTRCSVVNANEFFEFCVEREAWELLEKRASKTGVADYIETHKEVPPGVDFTTFKQINVRSK